MPPGRPLEPTEVKRRNGNPGCRPLPDVSTVSVLSMATQAPEPPVELGVEGRRSGIATGTALSRGCLRSLISVWQMLGGYIDSLFERWVTCTARACESPWPALARLSSPSPRRAG